MIADNNTWKQKALTPIVLKDTDDSFNTVKDLLGAIANDEILNIAVTGPYGSGKSSVIKTFKERVNKDVKILDISLATLDADASLYAAENTTSAGDQEKDKQQPAITSEQKETLNRKIEFSILQQLVYRKTLEMLPFSRLRKIRHFSKHTIQTMAMYVVGVVVLIAFALQLDFMQIPLFYEPFGVPITAQHVISIVSIILLLTMMYETVVYIIKNYGGIRLQKISVGGGNEIDIHDDGSIFNRYLDEILYFFQCTDYNVVIIEDLDRFNTTDIFLKLRELNHLINKSEMIGRTIKFVYAVKDDMFKDSSRSKFFDYITTVIPVITTTNSKDMLKRALKEQGHDGEVVDDDIRDIAFHIDDMRLLYNIVNEYHQYTQRLDKNGQHLEAKKMLAMMTVKNYHPHDFSELHNRKGRLYDILSPQTKRKFVDIAINIRLAERIKQAEEQLAAYDATCLLQEKELRLAYLVAIYDNLTHGTYAIVDDTEYQLSQIADDANLFEKLISKDEVEYIYNKYNYRNYRSSKNLNFQDIEKKVNEHFTYHQRLEQIGRDREKLEDEVQNTKLEIQRIGTYTISELLEIFNLYEDECFKSIGLSDMEEDFVRHGFIAEDYNDYIAYFYPDIMSLADHQLCLDMKLNRKPAYDSTIDNIELFLKELPETALRYESVWNFHILDYIVKHSSRWNRTLRLIVKTLTLENSANFLYKYYQFNENGANAVVKLCLIEDCEGMWGNFYAAKEKNTLLALWLRNCKTEFIDHSRHMWMKDNYDFIASIYNLLPKEIQVYVTTKVHYNELTYANPNMLDLVIKNGRYILNEHNMPIIVNNKKAKDDITKLDGLEEMKWAVKLELVTTSWHNVYKFFIESNNVIGEELKGWIENKIQKLCKDESYKNDVYSELFQSLYELGSLSDTVYMKLCKFGYWQVDVTNAVLNLPHAKLLLLIQSGSIEYNLDILKSFQEKDAILSCEYMFHYKTHLSEMLALDIVNSSLAEALLIHNGFSTLEKKMIVASLTHEAVTVSKVIANKLCALQATQYTVCDENILYDAISLCENEHDAVFAVGHKIIESGNDESVINVLISKLPNVYHALSETDNQLKLKDTDYNRFLVQTLEDANYISSYSNEDGEIILTTKQEG